MRQIAHDNHGLGEGEAEAEELPSLPAADPAPVAQPRVARTYGKSSKRASARAAFPAVKAIIAALVAFAALSSACLRLKGKKIEVGLVKRRLATGGEGGGPPEAEDFVDSWLCEQLTELEAILNKFSESASASQTDGTTPHESKVKRLRDEDLTQETTTGPLAKKRRLPTKTSSESSAWGLSEVSRGQVPRAFTADPHPAPTAEAGSVPDVLPHTSAPEDYANWENITQYGIFPGLLVPRKKDAQMPSRLSPTRVAASLVGKSSFLAPGRSADQFKAEKWEFLPRASASSSSTSSGSSFYVYPTTKDTSSGSSTLSWSITGSGISSSSSSSGTSGGNGSSGRLHGESFASISGSSESPSRAYSRSSLSSGPSSVSSTAHSKDLPSSTASARINLLQASDSASSSNFAYQLYPRASALFMLQGIHSQAAPPQQIFPQAASNWPMTSYVRPSSKAMPPVSGLQALATLGPSPHQAIQQQFSGLEHATGGWPGWPQQAAQEQQQIADMTIFGGFAAFGDPRRPPSDLPIPPIRTQVSKAKGWFNPLEQLSQGQHMLAQEAMVSSAFGASSAATSAMQYQLPQYFPPAMVLPPGQTGFMRLVRRPLKPRKRVMKSHEGVVYPTAGPSSVAGAQSMLPSLQVEVASSTMMPTSASAAQVRGVGEPSLESKVAAVGQPVADPLVPLAQPSGGEDRNQIKETASTSNAGSSAGGGHALSGIADSAYYASHPFYRLPTPAPNAQLPLFEPALRKCPGAGLGLLLQPVRSLLIKDHLTVEEMRDLMLHTRYVIGYAERYLNAPVPVDRPLRLLANLGKRFIIMDIVWSICKVVGPAMNQSTWWDAFAELVANPLPAPPHSTFTGDISSTAKQLLVRRLLAALEKYRMGMRPTPREVVFIKRELFCYKTSPLPMSDRSFMVWREDDPFSRARGLPEEK